MSFRLVRLDCPVWLWSDARRCEYFCVSPSSWWTRSLTPWKVSSTCWSRASYCCWRTWRRTCTTCRSAGCRLQTWAAPKFFGAKYEEKKLLSALWKLTRNSAVLVEMGQMDSSEKSTLQSSVDSSTETLIGHWLPANDFLTFALAN